jgi:hypothetical protein
MAKATKATSKAEATKADDGELELLTGAQIIDTDDLEHADIPVPAWGGAVRIRLMSAAEAFGWSDALDKDAKAAALALVRACAINPDGSRMFAPAAMYEALKKKSMREIRFVSDKCLELNGLGDGGERKKVAALLRKRAADEQLDAAVAGELVRMAEEFEAGLAGDEEKNG